MENLTFIKEQFNQTFLELNQANLEDYLAHLIENKEEKTPKEFHHILPVSHFPQFKKEKWNKIPLSPRNHYYAHLKLANLLETPQMIFALNQMRRVAKKEGTEISEEEISINFEKFRIKLSKIISENNSNFFEKMPEEEQKRLRKQVSDRTKGKIVVRYPDTGERTILPLNHDDIISGKAIFDNIGRKHSDKTKQKMSFSSKKENKGSQYTNSLTKEIKYFKEEEVIPENFVPGLFFQKEIATKRFTNRIYAHNKNGDTIRVTEDNIPQGFSKGRINFGENGNFFRMNIFLKHCVTNEKITIKKGEKIPEYYSLLNQHKLYRYKNEITMKRPNYCNEEISLDCTHRILELIESCIWVNELILPRRKTGTKKDKAFSGFIVSEEM